MAGSRSTEKEKPVSGRGRDVEGKRKSKRKVSESEDSSDSESGRTMEERKSKMRQDQMVDKSESKSKAVSSSEDDSSSDEKAAMPSSNTLKGLIHEDVANKQSISESEGKGPILFQKMFSDDDEVKILQVMIREGNDGGKKKFWKLHMDSMGLSIPVDECQLYEKARRLKGGFIKRLMNGNDAFFNDQERKVFDLCDKVWGEKERVKHRQSEKKLALVVVEEDVKKIRKKHKVKINEVAQHSHVKKVANGNGEGEVKKVANGNGEGEVKKVANGNGEGEVKETNYTKFVFEYGKRDAADFPFDEAMKVVPISMRPSFEKMLLDRNETRMELDMKTALLVHRLLEAIRSSSSQA